METSTQTGHSEVTVRTVQRRITVAQRNAVHVLSLSSALCVTDPQAVPVLLVGMLRLQV